MQRKGGDIPQWCSHRYITSFKGQLLIHAHSDKPNQMHGTHTHRKKQQIFAIRDDCSSKISRFSFYAVLPVPVMFPVLSGDMNIKIWSQDRQVARDRTRVFRVPSLNNGHHPDTMITATWHRVVIPWPLAFTIHTENLKLSPRLRLRTTVPAFMCFLGTVQWSRVHIEGNCSGTSTGFRRLCTSRRIPSLP